MCIARGALHIVVTEELPDYRQAAKFDRTSSSVYSQRREILSSAGMQFRTADFTPIRNRMDCRGHISQPPPPPTKMGSYVASESGSGSRQIENTNGSRAVKK